MLTLKHPNLTIHLQKKISKVEVSAHKVI